MNALVAFAGFAAAIVVAPVILTAGISIALGMLVERWGE